MKKMKKYKYCASYKVIDKQRGMCETKRKALTIDINSCYSFREKSSNIMDFLNGFSGNKK